MNDIFVIDNNTFHEGNNENCFSFFQANFKQSDTGINNKVVVEIITHLPTRNIIDFVVNNKQLETMIILKPIKEYNGHRQDISYKNGLYINSSKFEEYQTNPNNRQLEKEIKNNVRNKIKDIYVPPSKKNEINNYLKKLSPSDTVFDFDDFLKNEYLYYYHLTKFIIQTIKNDMTDNFNNNSFLLFVFNENLENNNLKITTIEQYISLISELNDDLTKKYSFIKTTNNFILIPDYKYLITPQDLSCIFNKSNNSFADFINLKLKIMYRYKHNINSIIDAGEKIDDNIITKEEWLELLDEVNTSVHSYFSDIFNINQVLDKDIELIPGIEISKDNIYIWTSVHPTVKFLYFTAEFIDDNVNKKDLKWEIYSRINLTDVIEYTNMNVLSKFIFNFTAKKRNVEFFNCFDNCTEWEYSKDKTPDVTKQMYESFIDNKSGGSKNNIININYIDNFKDKINLNHVLIDITRDELLNKYIKQINWCGSLTTNNCEIKIFGKDNMNKYVLYVVPYIIQNNELEKYLKNITKLFENFYISKNNYTLYLHKIHDNYYCQNKVMTFDILKQNKDTKKEYMVNFLVNKYFKILSDKISLCKFVDICKETGEKYISHMIYEGKALKIYRKNDIESFPTELVGNNNENNIFKYTGMVMITDKDNNETFIKNIVDFDNNYKSFTAKSPHKENDKKYFCEMALFVGDDNKIKFNDSIKINDINNNNNNKLFKKFFEHIYSIKNQFIIVGYPLPWRFNERIINIFSLQDDDSEYLSSLIKRSKKSVVDFVNNLNIKINKSIFKISELNIEVFAHYPNGNGDIHFHYHIFKSEYLNYHNRTINSDNVRIWNVNEIINFLNLKINFFKNFIYMTSRNIYYKDLYNKLIDQDKKKDCKNHNLINVNYINMQEGGDNSCQLFLSWIDKYLVQDNIFKLYSLPVIWIDYEIIETKKNISDKVIDSYYNCFKIENNNIVFDNFYNKLYDIYKNFNKNEYRVSFIKKLLFKNNLDVMFINKRATKYDNFYFSDDLKYQNYNNEYDSKKYDLVYIINNFDNSSPDKMCKTFMHFKMNVRALIWSLKHLKNDGVIYFLIREGILPSTNDLLLLLHQYSSVSLCCDYLTNDATTAPLYALCENFRDVDKIIKDLEKIITFDCGKNMGFLKIKKIIRGDIDKFNKPITKITHFVLTRIEEYIKCFKNNKGELQKMPEDISKLIETNALILMSKTFIPKPEHMPYISSLLHLKKMKVNGNYVKVHSNIKNDEGKLLYSLIKETQSTQILEIGMAYGLSSLFILQSLKYFSIKHNKKTDYNLTSIDPFQTTQWESLGVNNLINAHLNDNHTLIEEKSYIGMPTLLGNKKVYDLIFIDGWHTFDYTLLDLFYSFLLLKKDGYIVIDDALHPGVNKVTKYVQSNYPFLKKIDTEVTTVAVYQKIGDDHRAWNFHKDF
jgi:predicted O-methyltransferase YrrM